MKKVYYDLWRLTEQQCGMVIYGQNVICIDWSNIDGLPSMFGDIPVGLKEEITVKKRYNIQDVRLVLPGTISLVNKEAEVHERNIGKLLVNDMNILYDRFFDMLSIYGLKIVTKKDSYQIKLKKRFKPIPGTVYELDSGAIVIAPEGWN